MKKELLKYAKDSRNYLFAIILIFFIFSFLGYFFPIFFVDEIKKMLLSLTEQTKNFGFFRMWSFIFFNNIKTSFMGMILGVFFGIFPILVSLVNGYVLGFVMRLSSEKLGFKTILAILPHGIFELPALFISLGLGLKLSTILFRKKEKKIYYIKNSLKIFLYFVVPLLLIASIIETLLIFFIKN